MVELKLAKNKPNEEVIDALERLLADAKVGTLHQILYVAYIDNDCYIKGEAGSPGIDVHTSFGMLMDLALTHRANKIE